MRGLRRLVQAVAIAGTLIVGIIALALIVSQTPWFRDWLRRFIVRESQNYVNGDLSIGGLGGNLFFGVELRDVALEVSGEKVVEVRNIELDYSIFRILSSGVVLDDLKIHQPQVVLARSDEGWNIGALVKEEQQEAEREGPGRPIALQNIEVTDGRVSIRDEAVGTSGVNLPNQISDLDVKASFRYEPVQFTVTVDHLSLDASSPNLQLGQLSGKVAVRDNDIYVDQVRVHTGQSSVKVDGVIEDYTTQPVVKLTTTGEVSLPEIGRIVPALTEYRLSPAFEIKASGPTSNLALDLDVKTEAGSISGDITADVDGPAMGAEGQVRVTNLNLARILNNPQQRSDITGQAKLDLEVAATPEQASILERLSGSFEFVGPRVEAAGYEATDVDVRGEIDGPRISIDGKAVAYGGDATFKGSIVTPGEGRELSFDVAGGADRIDLRNIAGITGAPRLETDLSVEEYNVRSRGGTIEGRAVLNRSTVEGATIADGTVAQFTVQPRSISYSAQGSIESLDVERLGKALAVEALAKPAYDSDLNATFDIVGSMPRNGAAARREQDSTLATMTLTANGTLKNSAIMGGTLPQLSFKVDLADGTLKGSANGSFAGFDPGELAGRPEIAGDVTGAVEATFAIEDLAGQISPEDVTAEGVVTLNESTVGGLDVTSMTVDARVADGLASVKTLTLSGPDLQVNASGQLALNETATSNLEYRIEAIDIPALAKLAGQEGIGGSAIIQGTVTGNQQLLTTTGTLDGANLSYQDNNALDLNSDYKVSIPNLQFANARVEAATEGNFIKAGGLEIQKLVATTTYDNTTLEFDTTITEEKRELAAKGRVILHPDHQEIHLPQLAVRTEGVEWRIAPGTEAAIEYGNNRLQLENVHLVSGNQSLNVNGTLALTPEAPEGTLRVQAQNVDLQQLESVLLLDRGLAGQLNADATITGSTADPAVTGEVRIQNGAFETYKYESLVADIGYQNERAKIDATLTQTPAEQITVTGSVPMSLFRPSEAGGHVEPAAGDEIDLRIRSTALDLGIIQGFTTQVANVQGTLEADVHVTGSGEDPHLNGYVDIRNGAFGIPLGGVSYTGLNTRIDLTPDLVRLQDFQIRDAHGQPLSVSGQLSVHEKQVGAVNIAIKSNNFEVIDNELGDVGVDTDLRITGQLRRPNVVGSIRIEAGRLEVDRILTLFYDPYATESIEVVSAERTVADAGSAEEAVRGALSSTREGGAKPPATKTPAAEGAQAAASTEETGSIFQNLEMDVDLVIPNNLVLRGQDIRPGGATGAALGDMNITIGGNIDLLKKPGDEVRLVGTVRTIRGTYEFQGRRFELQRDGQLRFTGETEINPILDITATRLIPNTGVEAKIQVTGTAKQPELTLTSNPPLEESDILALIIFNRPVNELGTGERSSLAATAGGIATGFIAAPLGESIGKALDLDLFEITTTTENGELGAGITLGQQIGDRAFFRVRQQFGEQSTSEFMIEYQLASFLRLQATGAPQTTGSGNRLNQRRVERAGIDLIFFFSY